MKISYIFLLLASMIVCQSNASDLQVAYRLADKYIADHNEIAVSEMIRTGVPASIKLAQGMLESDWGRSDLATVANNHFGIKCGSKWIGNTFFKEDDDKNNDGQLIKSCFRSFDNKYESYIAHSNFLADPKKSHRYGFLFEYTSTDYTSWAYGLQTSGYATDPKYPNKLIQIIEKYELYKFDVEIHTIHTTQEYNDVVNGKPIIPLSTKSKTDKPSIPSSPISDIVSITKSQSAPQVELSKSLKRKRINNLKTVTADGQHSIADIATAYHINVDLLLRFNELFADADIVPKSGIIVYLQRKKSSYSKKKYHTILTNETMASIAHRYGMKLKSLYIKNRMPYGSEPLTGEKLNLFRTVSIHRKPKYSMQFANDEGIELLFIDDPSLH